MKNRILIVEGDRDASSMMAAALRPGYECLAVATGEEGMKAIWSFRPQVLVLDLTLPGFQGKSLLKLIREDPRIGDLPIIVVSGDAGESALVEAFSMGADDYITKPFSPAEVAARVAAALRRRGQAIPGERFEKGGIIVDSGQHRVYVAGKEVLLTPTEFRLLYLLMQKSGRVLSKDYLIESLWGVSEDVSTRTVAVHISALRGKLGRSGRRIETVREFGYRFNG